MIKECADLFFALLALGEFIYGAYLGVSAHRYEVACFWILMAIVTKPENKQ